MIYNRDNLYSIRVAAGSLGSDAYHLTCACPPKFGRISGGGSPGVRIERDTALRIIRWLRRHGHRAELI